MYGLEPSPLSIEAAWEHSQHHHHSHPHHSQHGQTQHTLNVAHPAHQRLESSHYQFGYSAAFPQYTIPPISPVSPSTSSISSSSSASSAEPTTPLAADYLGRRAFGGFNTHSISGAQGIDVDANTCLPTHQLFDFDFASHLAQGPPSPSLTSSSTTDSHGAPLMSPTSPMASVPSNSFSSTDAYDIEAELDNDASPAPAPRPTSAKRTAGAPTSTPTKKARASNSISTKDFVPPDVTGLSKREARLVKNRAAAFLSRQRKREEFELMEIRVAELEQENARLKSLVDNPSSSTSPTSSSSSESRSSPTPSSPSPEIEQLRAQLAAARTRENELAERLERVKYQAQREQAREREELVRLRTLVGTKEKGLSDAVEVGRVVVKEEEEPERESDTTSSGASTPANTVRSLLANPRSGASLGLMVLLCALPSLLSSRSSSIPTSSSSLPTASSFLDVHSTSAFDSSSAVLPSTDSTGALDWEFDWAGRPRARSSSRPASSSSSTVVSHSQTYNMDVDHAEQSDQGWTKLEFDSEEAALSDLGLGALDISFETRRAGDGSGRVRVRVLSSSSSSSSSALSASHQHLPERQNQQNQLSLPNRDESESDDESEDLGPFLTSTSTSSSSSACRSSSHTQSLMEGLNLGFGLNNYNGLNNFGMNDLMGVDTIGGLGMGMGMPFGTPDYGLDAATATQAVSQMRRRVRIALARLPHSGSEGGEWDVVEVAA